jgi:hypothetical protein
MNFMTSKDPAALESVTINIPILGISAQWKSNPTQRRAAWSLYIELVTRIAVQSLEVDQGLLREALNSLYTLFGTTREILKEFGPDVGASDTSVGGIAIAVLNRYLRPFLSKWHPLLQVWEAQRPVQMSPKEHEQNWSEIAQIQDELKILREGLSQYAKALGVIAGVEK